MNSLDKAILMFINKASKRIKVNFLLNLSIVGLKLLLCLIFSLLLISLFITIPYVEEISIGILIIGLIITLIYGFIKSPKKEKVSLIVDSKGLDERVTTALGLIGCEDNISLAQKSDTVEHIKNFDMKKNIKISIDKKQGLLSLGLIIMCFLVMLIPTNARKKAQKIRSFNNYQKAIIEKIERQNKGIEKSKSLSDEEKKEIKKILEDAQKELKESENKSEVNKTLERLEKKFKDKKEKRLSKLQNKLGNMSSSELRALSEALDNAILEMSDEELEEALKNALDSVLDENFDGESLSDEISKLLGNSNSSSTQSSNSKEDQNKDKGDGEGQGSGSGQGQGAGSGNGEGSGNGQGQGNGQGKGSGAGWDTGSTVGKEEDLNNSLGESIYIPGRNEGNDENLTGNKNKNGNSQQMESQNGINLDGQMVDYNKVIGDYSNSALEGANNSNLPENLKDIIKNYFEKLN